MWIHVQLQRPQFTFHQLHLKFKLHPVSTDPAVNTNKNERGKYADEKRNKPPRFPERIAYVQMERRRCIAPHTIYIPCPELEKIIAGSKRVVPDACGMRITAIRQTSLDHIPVQSLVCRFQPRTFIIYADVVFIVGKIEACAPYSILVIDPDMLNINIRVFTPECDI